MGGHVFSFGFKRVISKKVNKRKQSLFLTSFHLKKTFLKSKHVENFKNIVLSHQNLQYFLLFTFKEEIRSKVNKRKQSCFLVSFEIFKAKNYLEPQKL